MNKLEVLEDLLPGFQQFLHDLTTCRLSSALEVQVNTYNQKIEDYIAQNFSMPASLPPDPPTATNGFPSENKDAYIAEQREISRKSQVQRKEDDYYNVQVGTSQATDVSDSSAGLDNFYEPPTLAKSPPVPKSSRPPLRDVQDDPEAYENPDDFPVMPVKPQGKSATMPLPAKQMSFEPGESDSGGTFISFQSSSSSQAHDDSQEYEDLPDFGNYDEDEESWNSTDLEEYDQDEIAKHKTLDSANKAKSKPDKRSKLDKLVIFKKQYQDDPSVDHVGILYTTKRGMTISKKTFSQWDKRYCLAKDRHLLGYKNYDSERTTINLVLFGNTVTYVGLEGRRQNVFSVSHQNQGTELFSAESKEDADKWIEVLKGYAAMGDELVPSTGYVLKDDQGTHAGDEITKKLINFFKRDKKMKEMPPQLFIDDKGVLSGFINIMGAKYGEPKWRKKFVTIQNGIMECYTEDGDTLQFDFPLNGTDMMPADQKVTKRKTSMKICRDSETLIYVETFNHLDMGPFLKKYAEEMVPDSKKDLTSPKQRGMVSSILRAFEKQNSDPGEQEVGDEGSMYTDVQSGQSTSVPNDEESTGLSRKNEPPSIYQNFKIHISTARNIDEDLYLELVDDFEKPPIQSSKLEKKKNAHLAAMQHGRRKSTPNSPKLARKADEEAAAPDSSSKKDKKNKKKEKEKTKKDKKGKGKEEVVVKGEEVVAKEAEVAVVENTHEPIKKRVSVNKFKQSDKSHLLNVDRLEIERKEVDERKRVVTKRKIDLRAQKRESTDPKVKERLDVELQKAQQEWSECSNRLTFINNEIERFTKGGDTGTRVEQKQDTASAELVRNGISEKTRRDTTGDASPGREVAKRSVGNVKDKLKMFQGDK